MFDNYEDTESPSLWHQRRFVLKEHDATRFRYDLRLEIGGVLKSLVLTKPPSRDPRTKQVAIQVADHSPMAHAGGSQATSHRPA